MEKILTHEYNRKNYIHYIMNTFDEYTICGKKLHPISYIHINDRVVDCPECLDIVENCVERVLLLDGKVGVLK